MFSNRLASHLERGVVGFPTTLASSVGLIMASPVILTVTSGFGMGDREVPAGPLDVAFNLILNRYNGQEYLQLHLQDYEEVLTKTILLLFEGLRHLPRQNP